MGPNHIAKITLIQKVGTGTERLDDIYDGVLSDKILEVSGTLVGRFVMDFIGPPNSLKV